MLNHPCLLFPSYSQDGPDDKEEQYDRNRRSPSPDRGSNRMSHSSSSKKAAMSPEDIGMLALMNTQARAAVNDVSNHDPPKRPLIVWGNKPEWDCARLLCARSPVLRAHAAILPENHLAIKYGHDVRLVAQAEK